MAGAYYNIVEIESAARNLSIVYSGLCDRNILPNKSAEQRESSYLRISSGKGHARGTVLLLGGTHGREWGSSEILLGFVADLLSAYTKNAGISYGSKTFSAVEIHRLLQAVNIVVFPLINPDGLNFSHANGDALTTGGWRKNRNRASSGDDDAKIGVDINRNFDFLWDYRKYMSEDVWTSDDPASELYFGTQAFSEPEAKNVKLLLEAIPDIRWLVDIHSASKSILFNWGTGTDDSADSTKNFRNPTWDGKRGDSDLGYTEYTPSYDLATALALSGVMHDAILAVRGQDYSVKQSFDLYPATGVAEDYAYSRQWLASCAPKVQGFVIEFGEQFHPPWNEMKLIIADISAALFAFCLAVSNLPHNDLKC
jgi:murein tripeptide amidase MpaA